MSSVVIAGDTSGSVTLQAPAVAGSTVLTLPAVSGTVDVFPSGTRMSFQQTAAPTGWTKDTTAAIDNSACRFVTGTASSGGSVAFSTWAAQTSAGAYTLSTTDIPSHSHNITAYEWALGSPGGSGLLYYTRNSNANNGQQGVAPGNQATGGGGSHTHSLSQNIKYYDFIIASKN